MVDRQLNDVPFVVSTKSNVGLTADAGKRHAVVLITPAFRTSGLLFSLPSHELKNLLYILSFAADYGLPQPTGQQLAHAMQISEAKIRNRLQRLTEFMWQGEPIVREIRYPSGTFAYAVSTRVVNSLHPNEVPMPSESDRPMPIKDVIIAHSRAQYTRPRAQVEQDIDQYMGWSKRAERKEDAATAATRRELVALGLTNRRVDELFSQFGAEEAMRQLAWLPHRRAKDPVRMLVAAIEGHYSEPMSLHREKTDRPPRPPKDHR